MGNPVQQGTHSYSDPGSESCQNLGEYILVFLGIIISINIGINVLRCFKKSFLKQIFYNVFLEDNMLELAPIIPKEQFIHRPPAQKQTQRPSVCQDPPVCRNPPVGQNSTVGWEPSVCWNHSLYQNSTVCQNLAVHRSPDVFDLCTLDRVTPDQPPTGSCCKHSAFSQEPKQCLDTRLSKKDDKVSQYQRPGNWDSPKPKAHSKHLSACPPSSPVHFQPHLGRSTKQVKAKCKMELEACVYPIKPSSHNAKSQSCKESAEPDKNDSCPQFFQQVTISSLNCNTVPSTNHVMYNSWKKKRQVWETSSAVANLTYACPPGSLENPSQDWVYYYSLEECREK